MIRSTFLCALAIVGRTAAAQAPSNDTPKYPAGLYAIIAASAGLITAQLFEKETPVSRACLYRLAARHAALAGIFHRVIPGLHDSDRRSHRN
jgi:hypothetical protein